MSSTPEPIRAMTRLLAEMQTSIMAVALPLFDGRVDRFMVFTLLARRAFDGDRPTPVLAIAESLGLPFETTRRHVAELATLDICRRERAGLVAGAAMQTEPFAGLLTLGHDSLVRLVEDLGHIGALPAHPVAARAYDWSVGVCAAADLMLAVAHTNRGTHHDRLDLVLFSTILCANTRRITADPELARRHAAIAAPPPAALHRPLRARRLAAVLGLPEATVRRRLDRLVEGPICEMPDGLLVDEAWLTSEASVRTSSASYANLRRLIGALAAQGFPLHEPALAYRQGRPAAVRFG